MPREKTPRERTFEPNAQNSEQPLTPSSERIERILEETDPNRRGAKVAPHSDGPNQILRPSERESPVIEHTEQSAHRTDPSHRES